MRARLAVLVLALTLCSRARAAPNPIEVPPDLAREYRVEIDSETGCVALLHAWWGDPLIFGHEGCASYPLRGRRLVRRARDFFWSHADLFRLRQGVDDLTLSSAYECLGSFYVTFDTRYQGVLVFGAVARMRFTRDERIEAVGAACVPGIEIDPVPTISREEASGIAARAINGAIPGRATVEDLMIRRRRDGILAPSPTPGKPPETAPEDLFLTWPVTVPSHDRWPWKVFVDAHTGAVLSKYWMVPLDR